MNYVGVLPTASFKTTISRFSEMLYFLYTAHTLYTAHILDTAYTLDKSYILSTGFGLFRNMKKYNVTQPCQECVLQNHPVLQFVHQSMRRLHAQSNR